MATNQFFLCNLMKLCMYAEASLDTNFAKSESLGLGCQFHLIEMCVVNTKGWNFLSRRITVASEKMCLIKSSTFFLLIWNLVSTEEFYDRNSHLLSRMESIVCEWREGGTISLTTCLSGRQEYGYSKVIPKLIFNESNINFAKAELF